MESVFFDMLGCRLNQAEIEALARDFSAHGRKVVNQAEDADLIVVNTCCVTLKAAADSRKMVRHYQNHTNARVISTGCWNTAFPEQATEFLDQVDRIPNQNKSSLVNLLLGEAKDGSSTSVINLGRRNRTRGFVKVQDGCNNRCSYCLTQIARGPSWSEQTDQIINTIQGLQLAGVKEVVLTGVQIGSWGKELGILRIYNLVDSILDNTEIKRLRISSIEPWDVTDDLINRFDNSRFCPHLHIPIQSASDNILKVMRRPYSKKDLSLLISAIRAKNAEIAITTDLIVGFPGETDSDLQQTIEFIETNGFSGGHVFKFSPMPGTDASLLPNQVQESVKKVRLKQVQALLDRLSLAAMQRKVGSTQEVLFETGNKGLYEGYTPDYFKVQTSVQSNLTNTIQNVKLENVRPDLNFEGRLIGSIK